MLSSVLHTVVAEKVSIDIMRAFVSMRKYISSNLIEQNFKGGNIHEETGRSVPGAGDGSFPGELRRGRRTV